MTRVGTVTTAQMAEAAKQWLKQIGTVPKTEQERQPVQAFIDRLTGYPDTSTLSDLEPSLADQILGVREILERLRDQADRVELLPVPTGESEAAASEPASNRSLTVLDPDGPIDVSQGFPSVDGGSDTSTSDGLDAMLKALRLAMEARVSSSAEDKHLRSSRKKTVLCKLPDEEVVFPLPGKEEVPPLSDSDVRLVVDQAEPVVDTEARSSFDTDVRLVEAAPTPVLSDRARMDAGIDLTLYRKESNSDSEFELVLEGVTPAAQKAEGDKDIFGADFDVPALDEEEPSGEEFLDEGDTDLEIISDYDLALREEGFSGGEESSSELKLTLDVEEGGSHDSAFEVVLKTTEPISEELETGSAALLLEPDSDPDLFFEDDYVWERERTRSRP